MITCLEALNSQTELRLHEVLSAACPITGCIICFLCFFSPLRLLDNLFYGKHFQMFQQLH